MGGALVTAADQSPQQGELEARTRALEGFAEPSRDQALDSDPYALIRRAQVLAQSLLPRGFAVYYEPEGRLWRLKSQVGDVGSASLQSLLDAVWGSLLSC